MYMYVECRVSDGHREAGLDACTKMEEEITSKIRDALCLEWKRSILFQLPFIHLCSHLGC